MINAKIKARKRTARTLSAAVIVLLLSACARNAAVSEPPGAHLGVKTLLVAGFRSMADIYGEHENVRCPVCGNIFLSGKIKENATERMTEHTVSWMEKNTEFKLIRPEQGQGVLSGLLNGNLKAVSEVELLARAGNALDADAVLVGFLYRYTERVGSSYSADAPASAAFDLHLIRVADGRELWGGQFNETQRSLSEDLLQIRTFIRRKASWITVDEMAVFGLEELLETLPKP